MNAPRPRFAQGEYRIPFVGRAFQPDIATQKTCVSDASKIPRILSADGSSTINMIPYTYSISINRNHREQSKHVPSNRVGSFSSG